MQHNRSIFILIILNNDRRHRINQIMKTKNEIRSCELEKVEDHKNKFA